MTFTQTTDRLTKHDARRLTSGGFSIEYIETRHTGHGDETVVVWSRPSQEDDIPEDQIPY
ncbi:hypothetical protein [Acidiphilium acidophilum]|uniref:hypothetical protein n=1 Tax=Acidiphilium acidophilum TaxID=76588 RepID=UPI002E8E703E|nr:hypothetical protein [Acidiphilium acidophilum]